MRNVPPFVLALLGIGACSAHTSRSVVWVAAPPAGTAQIAVAPHPPRDVLAIATVPAPPDQATVGALAVRCPDPSRALAGMPVRLRAAANVQGLRYRWTVRDAPMNNRAYRFLDRYDANDTDAVVASGQEVPFTSVIVGDYTLQAEVRDAEGNTATCTSTVTMAGHGLRVELSWNTNATDVDLHSVMTDAPRWFTNADCYYANRRPDVGLPVADQQRWLDTDDVDGEGPENVRVDAPLEGRGYRVGVHFYSDHGHAGPTHAIVMVYCGEQHVARFERDLINQDFWHVADIGFRPGSACAVTVANRVMSSAEARSVSPGQ